MYCPRCKVKMKEEKRVYHRQRKWVCPRCGKVRMQAVKSNKTPSARQ
ncbi:MAG: hypothetical protein ACETWC_02295 [Acidobacteriota bacterium]